MSTSDGMPDLGGGLGAWVALVLALALVVERMIELTWIIVDSPGCCCGGREKAAAKAAEQAAAAKAAGKPKHDAAAAAALAAACGLLQQAAALSQQGAPDAPCSTGDKVVRVSNPLLRPAHADSDGAVGCDAGAGGSTPTTLAYAAAGTGAGTDGSVQRLLATASTLLEQSERVRAQAAAATEAVARAGRGTGTARAALREGWSIAIGVCLGMVLAVATQATLDPAAFSGGGQPILAAYIVTGAVGGFLAPYSHQIISLGFKASKSLEGGWVG
jgi:hypothetical protein